MCGRFALFVSPELLARQFDLPFPFGVNDAPQVLTPRFNIAPTQTIATIRVDATGGRALAAQRWGLIPAWTRDAASARSAAARTINARGETVADKPSFRGPLRKQRCIIPASGFYEWKAMPDGKQPYFIRPAGDNVFAFAGLWDRWQAPDGNAVESCTIITTAANQLMRTLHDRMPVILDERDYATWLDPTRQDAAQIRPLLRQYPDDRMRYYAVDRRVNTPRNDAADLITPLEST